MISPTATEQGAQHGNATPPAPAVERSCPSGCGACCSPVTLGQPKTHILSDPTIDPADRKWLVGLRRISRSGAVGRYAAVGIGADDVEFHDDDLYDCPRFDAIGRRCSDYENRPPVCRDYPWYGHAPTAKAAENTPSVCAFRSDAGVAVQVLATRSAGR